MTEVAFHSGVPDKLGYACRLLRKASRQGVRIVVVGAAQELARLDQALWTFEHEEFVPHARLRAGQGRPGSFARTPIWLCEPGAEVDDASVIVNLGPSMADGFQRFERAIEIVSTDEDDARSARQRWRQYVAEGCQPVNLPYRPASD